MATQRADEEGDVRRRIEQLIDGIRAMDLDRVMASYATDVVSFDVEPPLEHVGAEAKRKNWVKVFSMYERPLDYEIRDLSVAVGADVAFARGFVRISGRLKDGPRTSHWLRSTLGLRRIDGRWLIVHDQVSVPVDVASGQALLNLEP
jgi:ketosteroid isomerase-like protein